MLKNILLYKMQSCFNPNLGQIWTNPTFGLHLGYNGPFLTQIWAKTTLQFLSVH